MEEERRLEVRKLSREHSHLLWEVAKTGDLSSLSPEDKKWAEIMLEHEEYHNQFEIADLLSEHEYDVNTETNPFLHITLHAIAETQLANKDPIEVYQFYNAKVYSGDTIQIIIDSLAFPAFLFRDPKPSAAPLYSQTQRPQSAVPCGSFSESFHFLPSLAPIGNLSTLPNFDLSPAGLSCSALTWKEALDHG